MALFFIFVSGQVFISSMRGVEMAGCNWGMRNVTERKFDAHL
jgi:hypothetical protein